MICLKAVSKSHVFADYFAECNQNLYTLASLTRTLSLSSNMDPPYGQYWFAVKNTMTPFASSTDKAAAWRL